MRPDGDFIAHYLLLTLVVWKTAPRSGNRCIAFCVDRNTVERALHSSSHLLRLFLDLGQWRLVDKGDRGAELVDFLDGGQFKGRWTLRRQRIGRMGLSPLAAGQARVRQDFEKF